MRKRPWVVAGGLLLLLIAVIMATPLHFIVFPKSLSSNQRDVLRRANTGLAVYATKSPTAAAYYQEAQRSGHWSRFITVLPSPTKLRGLRKTYSVTVMSSNPMGLVAFYFHPSRLVCFVETACDSLGYLPLGLTYAHELGHRHDFEGHLVNLGDLPSSRPVLESEARSLSIETTILNEYTAGRFSQAVDRHRWLYRKLPLRTRRHHRVDQLSLVEDRRWVQQEFGHLTPPDQASLVRLVLLTAGIRTLLAGRPATTEDSLNAAIKVMDKQ